MSVKQTFQFPLETPSHWGNSYELPRKWANRELLLYNKMIRICLEDSVKRNNNLNISWHLLEKGPMILVVTYKSVRLDLKPITEVQPSRQADYLTDVLDKEWKGW